MDEIQIKERQNTANLFSETEEWEENQFYGTADDEFKDKESLNTNEQVLSIKVTFEY